MGILQNNKLPLLPCSVPNLSLDDLAINVEAPGSELNANSRLGFEAKLVPGEPREEIGRPSRQ